MTTPSPDDDAPTGLSPTELGQAVEPTEANTAWALDDGPELEMPRRLTPGRITALVVGACVVVIVGAAGVVGYHLRSTESVAVSTPTTTVNSTPDAVPTPTTPPPSERPGWGMPTDVAPTKTVTVEKPAPTRSSAITIPPKPPMTALQPDLMPSNYQFLGNLRAAGWSIQNPDMVIWRGHEACLMLREGEPPDLMARKMLAVDPSIPMDVALEFIEIVATTYPNCP